MNNNNLARIKTGINKSIDNKYNLIFIAIYNIAITTIAVLFIKLLETHGKLFATDLFKMLMVIFFLEIGLIGTLAIFYLLGFTRNSKSIETGLVQIGLVDACNNSPILVAEKKEKEFRKYIFYSKHISSVTFEKRKHDLEQVLGYTIVSIKKQNNIRYIEVIAIESETDFNKTLYWKDEFLSSEEYVLNLGKTHTGTYSINLDVLQHILIGGATSSGKTNLVLLILRQCLLKNSSCMLFDFKGGIDYHSIWDKKVRIVTKPEDFLSGLLEVKEIIKERQILFSNAKAKNIVEYCQNTNKNIPRMIICVDEIAEVTDTSGLTKEQKNLIEKIIGELNSIARIGRAFGVHLLISTQKPSVDVVPSQLRSNLNCRICGLADSVLSKIVLDNTSAAEMISPNDKGVFLSKDGELFKAYYCND